MDTFHHEQIGVKSLPYFMLLLVYHLCCYVCQILAMLWLLHFGKHKKYLKNKHIPKKFTILVLCIGEFAVMFAHELRKKLERVHDNVLLKVIAIPHVRSRLLFADPLKYLRNQDMVLIWTVVYNTLIPIQN